LDAIFDVEQPLFRLRKQIATRQEVSGDGLRMTIQKWSARPESFAEMVVDRDQPARPGLSRRHVAWGWIVCCDGTPLLSL
jgi:hypothetical protein